MLFCRLVTFFFKINVFGNTIRLSNSLDPDQARRFVGPGLGQNRLQNKSADATSMQIYT